MHLPSVYDTIFRPYIYTNPIYTRFFRKTLYIHLKKMAKPYIYTSNFFACGGQPYIYTNPIYTRFFRKTLYIHNPVYNVYIIYIQYTLLPHRNKSKINAAHMPRDFGMVALIPMLAVDPWNPIYRIVSAVLPENCRHNSKKWIFSRMKPSAPAKFHFWHKDPIS